MVSGERGDPVGYLADMMADGKDLEKNRGRDQWDYDKALPDCISQTVNEGLGNK